MNRIFPDFAHRKKSRCKLSIKATASIFYSIVGRLFTRLPVRFCCFVPLVYSALSFVGVLLFRRYFIRLFHSASLSAFAVSFLLFTRLLRRSYYCFAGISFDCFTLRRCQLRRCFYLYRGSVFVRPLYSASLHQLRLRYEGVSTVYIPLQTFIIALWFDVFNCGTRSTVS